MPNYDQTIEEGEWTVKRAKIVYSKNFKIDEVDRRMYGSFVEHLGRCVYGGIYQPEHPEADAAGFRNDVKELIRELGVTAIRYPGGNFVSGYDWKDGVGPKEGRPVRKELAWNVLESNEVGTNEFAQFARECNTEVIMAVNLGTGTPKEAAQLVEYCNTQEGTAWSDMRRSHGVEQAYGFKTWCLGNEMDGEWQIQMLKADEYARKAKEAAKMMRWTDPSIELIACGTCTNEIGHTSFGDWDLAVLEECYDQIDYLSLHRYYNYNPNKQLFYPMHDDESDIPFFFRDLRDFMDTIISACDFVKGKRRSGKKIHLSFDEWGVVTDTGAVPGGVAQKYEYASFKLLDAVIYGGLLCTFLNYADRVKIACQSLLVNEGGMITTDPGGKAIRQATFYPFQDVARYGRGTALRGSGSMPVRRTNHHGEQETVTTACVYNEENRELTVFAMNCDPEEDLELSIEFQAFGALQGIGFRELYHDDPYARNTFEEEDRVVPFEREIPDCVDNRLHIVLKKHSWNVLRFQEKV